MALKTVFFFIQYFGINWKYRYIPGGVEREEREGDEASSTAHCQQVPIQESVVYIYAKWKTRILRQIHTADPVGMGSKSRQYTMFQYSVQAGLSVFTDGISCMYLAQYPRLPFCGLIYIQLIQV